MHVCCNVIFVNHQARAILAVAMHSTVVGDLTYCRKCGVGILIYVYIYRVRKHSTRNAQRKGGVGVGEQPVHVSNHHTHGPTACITGELRVLKHVETANSRVQGEFQREK